MERTQLFDLMGELKLYGMKAAFDEIMVTAVKRQHEPQRIVGDLLSAEIQREAGPIDQVPAHHRQAAACQGHYRLPIRRSADQPDARQRSLHLTRMDFIVLDELGYLPFAQSGGQLLFHLISRLYAPPSSSPPTSPSESGPACSAMPR
jgi:hypothetical protein